MARFINIGYLVLGHGWVIISIFFYGMHPDSKVHGANMGPIWDRQTPGTYTYYNLYFYNQKLLCHECFSNHYTATTNHNSQTYEIRVTRPSICLPPMGGRA